MQFANPIQSIQNLIDRLALLPVATKSGIQLATPILEPSIEIIADLKNLKAARTALISSVVRSTTWFNNIQIGWVLCGLRTEHDWTTQNPTKEGLASEPPTSDQQAGAAPRNLLASSNMRGQDLSDLDVFAWCLRYLMISTQIIL